MAISSAGDSPLLIAVRNGWFDTAKVIMEKGQESDLKGALNSRGTNRETVLTWILKWSATFALDMALLKQVLAAGANAGQAGFKEKVPPVCLAAAAGELEALELLCTAGADINATDGQKRNALHYASAKGTSAQDLPPCIVHLSAKPAVHTTTRVSSQLNLMLFSFATTQSSYVVVSALKSFNTNLPLPLNEHYFISIDVLSVVTHTYGDNGIYTI
jgi:hypothetical protein